MQQFMRSGGDNQVTTKVTTQPTPFAKLPVAAFAQDVVVARAIAFAGDR